MVCRQPDDLAIQLNDGGFVVIEIDIPATMTFEISAAAIDVLRLRVRNSQIAQRNWIGKNRLRGCGQQRHQRAIS